MLSLVSSQLSCGKTRISWKVISAEVSKTPRQCFDLWTQRSKTSSEQPQKQFNMLYLPLLNFVEDEYTINYDFNLGLD
eukprot:EST41467.1 Myb-like DNA-binding domain-containing protein [Spironucleus salmonicida]